MAVGNFSRLALPVIAVLLVWGITACGSSDANGDDELEQSRAAIADYRTYLEENSTILVKEVQALLADVEEGDRAGARAHYVRARRAYGNVKPLSVSFPELDSNINNRPSAFLSGKFEGFHRVERTLWTGLPLAGAVVYARQLLENVRDLRARILAADLRPEQIVRGAHGVADGIFSVGLIGTEEAYSHIDLVDVAAGVEGLRAASEAVQPQLRDESKLSKQIELRLGALEATMDRLQTPAGFPAFDQISFTQVSRIGNQIEALGLSLSQAQRQIAGAAT